MHITMVKKRLKNGDPCRKCAQAEELLRTRGHWERIDEVIWADEANPESEGIQLGRKHKVELAPFFIVRSDDGREQVYTSALKFIKEQLTAPPAPVSADAAELSEAELQSWKERLAQASPEEVLRAALTRYGADCSLSFSGAEDVVLIDMAVKLGLPFSAFSLDTGRLPPETYRFLEKVRTHYGIELELLTPDPALLQPFVRKKGLFSFYEEGHTECCSIRKVEPLGRRLQSARAWVTGQRKDQSVTRSRLDRVEFDSQFSGSRGPLVKFNPLTDWTSAQVWNYIREHDVPFNTLHERGFISIGCEPCTRAVLPGEHERAGRWWWEEETKRECGLHVAR